MRASRLTCQRKAPEGQACRRTGGRLRRRPRTGAGGGSSKPDAARIAAASHRKPCARRGGGLRDASELSSPAAVLNGVRVSSARTSRACACSPGKSCNTAHGPGAHCRAKWRRGFRQQQQKPATRPRPARNTADQLIPPSSRSLGRMGFTAVWGHGRTYCTCPRQTAAVPLGTDSGPPRVLLLLCLRSVGKQVVNVPSFMVRVDSQKHIDFALTSPFGGGRPGRVKRKNAK